MPYAVRKADSQSDREEEAQKSDSHKHRYSN